ncbi:MAG: hypothetical protein NDJ89_18865 [Oligoflexia bacterium]|nr:hypothetical protein [Oligoflexia bacterium]
MKITQLPKLIVIPVLALTLLSRAIAGEPVEGTRQELEEHARYAVSHRYNAVQLLRDMARDYTRQGLAVRFLGDDLRELSRNYSLGNDVAMALLPVEQVDSFVAGERDGKAHFAVTLKTEPVKTYFRYLFFRIEVLLERTYGAYDIGEQVMTDIRGLQINGPMGTSRVVSLSLGNGNDVQVTLDRAPHPTVKIPPITEK